MNRSFKIVKIENLSGPAASIYTIQFKDDRSSLFGQFVEKYRPNYPREVNRIISKVWNMGHEFGIQDHLIEPFEGKPGDGVCTVFDTDNAGRKLTLRLYGISFGHLILILGSGAPKIGIKALQENKELCRENYLLRDISNLITDRIREREIQIHPYRNEFYGDLEFDFEN